MLKPETGRIVVLSSEDDDMTKLSQKLKMPILNMAFRDGSMRSFGWKYKFGTWYESKIDASDPRKIMKTCLCLTFMFMFLFTEEVIIKLSRKLLVMAPCCRSSNCQFLARKLAISLNLLVVIICDYLVGGTNYNFGRSFTYL